MKRLGAVVLLCVSLAPSTKGQADDQKILYDFCYADPWVTWDVVCELGITNADGYTPTSVVYRPLSTNWLTGGPHDARSTQPAPSPDGSRIAFVRGAWFPQEGHPSADVDLFLFTIADASLVQLTSGPANDASPAWSPDGGRIAFASDRDGPLDLYVMNADGSGITRLTSNVGFVGAPAWAPDGERIAFDCRPAAGANTDICASNSDGSGFVRLTTHPADDSGAAFAPTDGRIAFATRRFGATFELVIGAPGGQVQRVGTGTPGVQPAWSPDGTRLAYMDPDSVSYTGRCYFDGEAHNADDFCVPVNDLFVVNVDGSGKAQFASGAHARWMAPRSAGSSPYFGAPVAVPGRIEAENYDKGGRGVGYADLTAGNSGGEYRPDDVDIERVTGSATDYNVGWMVAGEWLQYTIDVGNAGSYTVEAQVASYGGGGTFHLEVNGAKSGSIQVSDTGGWQQWQTVTTTLTVGAGVQQLRVVLDTNGASGGVGNLDYLRLSRAEGSGPAPLGFTVRADSFAGGAQGCWRGPLECGGGYYDETPGNWGDAQVRPGTDVDLWYDDGGIVIGGLDGLEWVTFPVKVPQAGNYAVRFRTASPSDRPAGSGVINVGIHGVDGSWVGNQHVPVTGGPGEWHTYVSWDAPRTIYLPAGQQTLTMWASGGWYNVGDMTFTLAGEPVLTPREPTIPNQLNHMVLSGTVTNPDGVPLAGAHLQIAYQGKTNEYLGLETDANGRYEVAFDAIPNGYDGWLAFVSVWKDWLTTYEIHNQLIAVETQRATYDVRLRSAEWILANQSALLPESVDVTVRADDPVCYNDAQTLGWGMEWMVCHPLRLIAPSTGTLRIEMVPIGPVTTTVGLEFGIIGAGSAHCCGAGGVRFLRVSAGDLVVLNPQVSLGGTQSFRIFLTMQMDSPSTSGWPAPQRSKSNG